MIPGKAEFRDSVIVKDVNVDVREQQKGAKPEFDKRSGLHTRIRPQVSTAAATSRAPPRGRPFAVAEDGLRLGRSREAGRRPRVPARRGLRVAEVDDGVADLAVPHEHPDEVEGRVRGVEREQAALAVGVELF